MRLCPRLAHLAHHGLYYNGSQQTIHHNGTVWSNAEISMNGSGLSIDGDAHADSSFTINGSNETITGRAEWVTAWSVNGSGQSLTPLHVAASPRDYPIRYTVNDFGPYTYDVASFTANESGATVRPGSTACAVT